MGSSWLGFFLDMAELISKKSKDRSTKIGVVIAGEDNEVLSVGFNGFPRGVDDDVESRHERPAKYQYTEHAERNAIYNAARQGIRLQGSTLYMNWEPYPCPDCARAIVQAGIKKIVGNDTPFPNKGGVDWQESFKASKEILKEGGVELLFVKRIGGINE